MMIHSCRTPFRILPQLMSDQICHAVVQTRTVKPIKASEYSTTYSMHEQKGTFNGIDTCSITNFGRFDITSKLNADSESRAIRNRPDINAFLTQLVKDKKISSFVAEGRRKEAVESTKDIDFIPYFYGSTFVPFYTAIELQRDMHKIDKDIKVSIDNREDSDEITNGSFQPSWPSILYPCHR